MNLKILGFDLDFQTYCITVDHDGIRVGDFKKEYPGWVLEDNSYTTLMSAEQENISGMFVVTGLNKLAAKIIKDNFLH